MSLIPDLGPTLRNSRLEELPRVEEPGAYRVRQTNHRAARERKPPEGNDRVHDRSEAKAVEFVIREA